MKLDRTGLGKLLLLYPRSQLSRMMGVSLPALRRYIAGSEPNSDAVCQFMNVEIARRLSKLPEEPVLVLMRYLNVFANHRISLDENREGAESGSWYVLRYPVILTECRAAYWQKTGKLLVDASHLDVWLREEAVKSNPVMNLIVLENLQKMDLLVGTEMCDLLQGSGLHRSATLNYVLDVSKPIAEKVRLMLNESASREDPSQDGRVNLEKMT